MSKWKDDQEFEPLTPIHLVKSKQVIMPLRHGGRLIKKAEFSTDDAGFDWLIARKRIKPAGDVPQVEAELAEEPTPPKKKR